MRKLFILFVLWSVLLTSCVGRAVEMQAPASVGSSPTHVITPSRVPPSPTSISLSATALENFFGDSSCSWPCWQGITPGITTSSEALLKLHDSPLILKKYSIQSEGSETENGEASWRWNVDDNQREERGNIQWTNGVVRMMELTAYPVISLGEIINRFGPPEKIDVIDCTEIVEGPRWWCGTLYYAKSGFEIHVSWEDSAESDVQITPSDLIVFVRMFEPSTLEKWLADMGLNHLYPDLCDWNGYGSLYDLYVK